MKLTCEHRGAGYNFYGEDAGAVSILLGAPIETLNIWSSMLRIVVAQVDGVRVGAHHLSVLMSMGVDIQERRCLYKEYTQ